MLEQKHAALVRRNYLIVVLIEQVGRRTRDRDPNSTEKEMRLSGRRKVTGLCSSPNRSSGRLQLRAARSDRRAGGTHRVVDNESTHFEQAVYFRGAAEDR